MDWSDWPEGAHLDGGEAAAPAGGFDPGERYQLLEHIDVGAMGSVWRARDRATGDEVALKALLAAGALGLRPGDIQRLRDEFVAGSAVVHPGLVTLHEFAVSADGTPFFTMDFVHGVHLRRWLRPPGTARGWSKALAWRLADAVPQLVVALQALHRAGIVHRDVKPRNVLVTAEGRVVVLDFGLASARVAQRWDPDRGKVLGTAWYMAAEQAAGLQAGPAADWSALGAILYEAIAGDPPYTGRLHEILAAKQALPTPRPGAVDPDVPAAVDALVAGLLHPWPGERPGPEEIVAVLSEAAGRVAPAPVAPVLAPVHPLVGRQRELTWLNLAEDRRRSGRPVLVEVRGRSGMGKSSLLAHHLDQVEKDGQVVVLRGRCHPRVSVPYKAVDEVVGQLRRFLLTRSPAGRELLRPEQPEALARLFPVLEDTWDDDATQDDPVALDPAVLRRQGFRALRQVFDGIARRRGLVVWIDDLQWGDRDSLRLLAEVMGPPDAPPLLLLLSYRSEDAEEAEVLRDLARGPLAGEARTLDVGPLDVAAVEQLLARALDQPGAEVREAAARITRLSGGSPWFVMELTRSLLAVRGEEAAPDLDQLVARRLRPLHAEARRLLELVCTLGGPLPQAVALGAAGLGPSGRTHVYGLLQAGLLRRLAGEAGLLAPYHDRIREAVVGLLPAEERRGRHGALARALEAWPEAQAETLVEQWAGAGDPDRAVHHARAAAERAAAALAFDRAAELYRLCLDLRGEAADADLLARLGRAKALAGRGAQAGDWYAKAADVRETEDPVDALSVLGLRREAAIRYLQAGHLGPGQALLGRVLEAQGIAVPTSAGRATLTAVLGHLRLAFTGVRFDETAAQQVAPETLARLDTLWGATTALAMIDYARAHTYGVRHLAESLRVGEPSRVLRALALEATFYATAGGGLFAGRVSRFMAQAEEMAARTGDPYDRAWVVSTQGSIAWFGGQWQLAAARTADAYRVYRHACRAASWEADVTVIYWMSSLGYLGRLAELSHEVDRALRDARERGDRFLEMALVTGEPALLACLRGDPRAHLAEADAAIESWPTSDFGTQHYHHLVDSVRTCLVAGEPAAAWARVEAAWPRVKAAQLLTIKVIGAELRHLRGRAALAAGHPREALAEARRLGKGDLPMIRAFGATLEAGARPEAAEAPLRRAIQGFEEADMGLYLALCRLALAERTADPAEARLLTDLGRGWARKEGVVEHLPALRRGWLPGV